MTYWRLHTSDIRGPLASASANTLGVYFRICGYCAEQENNGRVPGAMRWRDRQLIAAFNVTVAELQAAIDEGTLVSSDGDDLIISFYPHKDQKALEVQKTGKKRAVSARPETLGSTLGSTHPEAGLTSSLDKIREEKKGEEKIAPKREEFVSSDSEFLNAANRGDAAAAIARSYPANGSEHRAAAAIVRVLASGTITEAELRAKVARHAKCWHALPPRLRNFCPGRAAYFEESRFNDDPKLGPWIDPDHSSQADEAEKKSGSPTVPERRGSPAPADWSDLYAEEMELPASAVPHSWSLVPADVQRRIVAAAERRAA